MTRGPDKIKKYPTTTKAQARPYCGTATSSRPWRGALASIQNKQKKRGAPSSQLKLCIMRR